MLTPRPVHPAGEDRLLADRLPRGRRGPRRRCIRGDSRRAASPSTSCTATTRAASASSPGSASAREGDAVAAQRRPPLAGRPPEPALNVLLLVVGDTSPETIRQSLAGGPWRVHVVAPTVVGPLDWLSNAEEGARLRAEVRGLEAERALEGLVPVTSAAGDVDPVQAVADALAEFPATEILVAGASADLDLERALARFRLPVRRLGPPPRCAGTRQPPHPEARRRARPGRAVRAHPRDERRAHGRRDRALALRAVRALARRRVLIRRRG